MGSAGRSSVVGGGGGTSGKWEQKSRWIHVFQISYQIAACGNVVWNLKYAMTSRDLLAQAGDDEATAEGVTGGNGKGGASGGAVWKKYRQARHMPQLTGFARVDILKGLFSQKRCS
jgi:hypothetical protein